MPGFNGTDATPGNQRAALADTSTTRSVCSSRVPTTSAGASPSALAWESCLGATREASDMVSKPRQRMVLVRNGGSVGRNVGPQEGPRILGMPHSGPATSGGR
mmetsp:Transcript_42881/g.99301  ORF Transcript_42881/g.99301 Transcript_42881/m.99301 type:complete len:103 (+) Transcript_42881:522-830(+)